MNRLRVARAIVVSIVLAGALGVSQSAYAAVPPPPQDHPYDPAEWSGFVVDFLKFDFPLDPAAAPRTSDLRTWNALTVYDFTATPLLGGEVTGNLYIETEPSPGIVCAHRTTWSETYALQKHPGEYVGFVGWSADQYTLDAAGSVDLPLSQTDAYTGDPSWCATGTFTSDAAGSFPLQWDNTHGTYAVGDTKLQGDVDKFYGPQFPGVEEHFCWRLTWLPDGDHDGLPDSEDSQPAVFDSSICQGGSKNALSVSVAGQGTVTSSDNGINCPPACSASYQSGDVSLTPHPAAGWRFAGWSGDCTGTASCSLSMSQSRSVAATFEPITFALNVAVAGSGRVDSTPPGITCPVACAATYAGGAVVSLAPHAAPGWRFLGWAGGCTGVGTCEVAMTQARAVTATFTMVDSTAPDTIITGGTADGTWFDAPTQVRFVFTGRDPVDAVSTLVFQCQLDRGTWTACQSPYSFASRGGAHMIAIRAVDPSGNVDPSPASRIWAVNPGQGKALSGAKRLKGHKTVHWRGNGRPQTLTIKMKLRVLTIDGFVGAIGGELPGIKVTSSTSVAAACFSAKVDVYANTRTSTAGPAFNYEKDKDLQYDAPRVNVDNVGKDVWRSGSTVIGVIYHFVVTPTCRLNSTTVAWSPGRLGWPSLDWESVQPVKKIVWTSTGWVASCGTTCPQVAPVTIKGTVNL